MTGFIQRERRPRWPALFASGDVWLGYRAVVEWEHAAEMVASKRAEAAANLLIAALARDMRGAQLLVLSAADSDGVTRGTGVDLLDPITDALARYPYPDVFFSWRAAGDASAGLCGPAPGTGRRRPPAAGMTGRACGRSPAGRP